MRLIQTYIKRFTNLEQKLDVSFSSTEKFLSDGKKLVCSDPDLINKIQNQVDNLISLNNTVLSVLRNINNLISYINSLQKALRIVQDTIITIKAVATVTPTSIPPGIGIPVGVILNTVEILKICKEKIDLYTSITKGINNLLLSEARSLQKASNKINEFIIQYDLIKKQLSLCGKDISKLENIINELKDNNTKLIEALPKNIKDENGYKGYTFQIIEEEQTDSNIKVNRRYAVALNKNGIREFTSFLTYATNTELLINDLKFQIDQKEL